MTARRKELDSLADLIGYVLVGAPNFPEFDRLGLEGNFDRLLSGLQRTGELLTRGDAAHWMVLAVESAELARQCFRQGDVGGGKRALQDCEEYFANARRGKASKATFIVGPDGTASRN